MPDDDYISKRSHSAIISHMNSDVIFLMNIDASWSALGGLHHCHRPGRLAQLGASLTANQGVAGSSPGPATFFRSRFGHEEIYTNILTLPLIQEGQLSVTGKRIGY